MTIPGILILAELFLLFLITRRIHRTTFALLLTIFRSRSFTIGLVTILYLPGTIIHELSHLFTAEILRVPTGEISFTPTIPEAQYARNELQMGSVQITQTDPFRRFLIGFAPIVWGLITLSLLIWLFQYFWPHMREFWQQALYVLGFGYLLFSISTNMFSSSKDMEGAIVVVPVLTAISLTLYLLGVRISLTGQVLEVTVQVLNGLSMALGIVLAINLVLLSLNYVLLRGLRKLGNTK